MRFHIRAFDPDTGPTGGRLLFECDDPDQFGLHIHKTWPEPFLLAHSQQDGVGPQDIPKRLITVWTEDPQIENPNRRNTVPVAVAYDDENFDGTTFAQMFHARFE